MTAGDAAVPRAHGTPAPVSAETASDTAPPEPGGGVAVADLDDWAEIVEELRSDPHSFQFFQAVRLLERLQPERASPGGDDPANEAVRFEVNPSIAFPASEIQALELPRDATGPARMTVNFMGLTGPLGVLPYHYSLLVAERLRAKDGALRAFLDLFHHRMISLFYRAWEKHRFTLSGEKGKDDRLRQHVLDLIGMGLEHQRNLLPVPDDALVFLAGLLAPQQRGAVALQQVLEEVFQVPVEVEQFVGGWYRLPAADRCAVGEENGASTRLGLGAVAGDEVWDQQARVRVRIGPLSRERFDAYLPSGSAHEPLRALLRFFSHDQFDFEVQLVLARDEVPGCVLGADRDAEQPLGWATWIRTRPFARDADEAVFTL